MNSGRPYIHRDSVCAFCGRACRVPVTRYMPARVIEACEAARLDSLATCPDGAADEHQRIGASYGDVITERVHRVAAPAHPEPNRVQEGSDERAPSPPQ